MSLKTDKETNAARKRRRHPFRAAGRLLRLIFGKARWLLLGVAVSLAISWFYDLIDPNGSRIIALTPKLSGETVPVSGVVASSVSRDGWTEILMKKNSEEISALVNIVTGEQRYSQAARITEGLEYYVTSRFVFGNDGKMYAAIADYANENSSVITRERIVSVTDDLKVDNVYFSISHDESEGLQVSRLSGLCLADGKITFASVEHDETILYSVDPGTHSLSVSDPYPSDPDGTFTFDVIPLSDSFLFMRSDGNVYRPRFGEPLGESIFRFEENVVGNGGFFRYAAAVGDKLYVYRYNGKGRIYTLENGVLTEAFDIRELDGREDRSNVVALGCCRSEGSDTDLLAVSLNDGFVTFDGSNAKERNVKITLKNSLIYVFWNVNRYFGFFCCGGLVINLIIRKKTLLYKQILLTLPVLLIPAIAAAINLYLNSEEENTRNIEKELDLVCRMGISALDGYDYSGLDRLGADTGAAVRRLESKLNTFDPDNAKYIFSVVKRTDESNAEVLARTDRITMPQYFTDTIVSEKEILEKTGGSGNYLFKEIQGMMSDGASYSEIYVLGRLNSTDGGEYYLKVKTNNWNFWTTRRDMFFDLMGYILLIIFALTAITVISSMYITRTIKKATKAVEKISGGDLSARISYRSKDELGEICSQVNGMAQSLETLFAEKDRTERFYYKFVPEKFRELLGKDSFTDLELGDASSRDLTVLFFDIRSFSINSEIMTAKENFEFVNVIYGRAGPIVRKYGGFVDKYIGDAVMALFENAEGAVMCGIELYKAIVLDRSTAEAIHISDLNIGIGIHSGMARIGIVGESERLSGTVISDTVNLSSRLETLTKQYKTAMLVSKDTVDRMADPDSLGLRYLGIIQVAGVNEVKAVYEVLDCLPDEERLRRSENALELREAIRLFHLGRRKKAAEILKGLAAAGRNDHVTDMYLEYITSMSDDDKGNVFRFVRK